MKKIFLLLLTTIILSSCHSKSTNDKNPEVITVNPQTISTTLFYSGTIQPLKTISVISPAEGIISDMTFHYGDTVKSGQLLFSINSEKFFSDYKTALMQYIKSKNDYDNNQNQFKEGDFLHKNELISDDDYKSRQTNFYNAQLAFVQAKDTLNGLLKQLQVKDLNLYQLNINDIQKIVAALNLENGSKKLEIFAPQSGVVLLPGKSDSGSADKHLGLNDQVKQGDVLALIGDPNQFSISINVNEFDINQIKVGQQVKITGAAFPDFTLEGKVNGIDHQAQMNQNSMPNFSVQIVFANLTPAEQAVIRVGMSAKIEIDVAENHEITIPMSAIQEKNGVAYVKLQDKNGGFHLQSVKTGKTTEESIVILSNLKAGDKILQHEKSLFADSAS